MHVLWQIAELCFYSYGHTSLCIIMTSPFSDNTSVFRVDFSSSPFHLSSILCSNFLPIFLSFPSPHLSSSIMYSSITELWYTLIYKISCTLNKMEIIITSLGSCEDICKMLRTVLGTEEESCKYNLAKII